MKRTLGWTTVLFSSLLMMNGCSISVDESPDDDDWSDPWHDDEYSATPPPTTAVFHYEDAAACTESTASWYKDSYHEHYNYEESYMCYETEDYSWQTSCGEASCNPLKVYVHYMLTQELGTGLNVHIEAFDNAQFTGYPLSTVTVNDYAAKIGEAQSADLYLEPGEYYLRAYISNQDSTPRPYPFGNMELVADEPVGVYGALSGPQRVVIKNGIAADPLHIKLDKLFKQPGSEADTEAYLRTIIQTEHHADIATGANVYIEMFADDDFEREPAHKFVMLSNLLKIEGEQGEAEFVSPSLPIGNYFVRAYVDSNRNGFYDQDELFDIHEKGGLPQYVQITEKTVRSIILTLSPAANE